MDDTRINQFYEMLKACYDICGWIFSPSLEVLDTNSQLPYLHRTLLLGRGRDQAILAHAARTDVPMVISDSMGVMWGVVEKREGPKETIGHFYVLGPLLSKETEKSTMETLVAPLNLSLQNKWELLHDLSLLPHLSTVVFFQLLIMLHYYVNGDNIRISSFDYYTPRQMHNPEHRDDLLENMPHASYLTEKKLLDMVRTGNLEFHTALGEAGVASPGIRVKRANPVQQAKYSVVAFITLCTRAAMEGGLSSEIAYTLSDTYTQSVEQARSVSQVAAVSHTMYEDFIRRVNQIRQESGVSPTVQLCCDYIDLHPEKELSLSMLADKAGYSESYLARKFRKELGLSVSDYVRMARIHRAKMLLGTGMNIQEIADRLHFCSGSYFAEAFRKETGVSPSEYREKFSKESR